MNDVLFKLRVKGASRVCHRCGVLYGKGPQKVESTWIADEKCDICEEITHITDFRDYGYAKSEYYLEENYGTEKASTG